MATCHGRFPHWILTTIKDTSRVKSYNINCRQITIRNIVFSLILITPVMS